MKASMITGKRVVSGLVALLRAAGPAFVALSVLALGIALATLHAQGIRKPSSPTRQQDRGAKSAAADQFIEVSKQSGIHFTLTSGGPDKSYIIEAKGGGGIAWIDHNNDGYPDLFLVNGSTFEDWRRGTSPRSRLYRNNRDGTFTDVSAGSGLDRLGGTERDKGSK